MEWMFLICCHRCVAQSDSHDPPSARHCGGQYRARVGALLVAEGVQVEVCLLRHMLAMDASVLQSQVHGTV